MNLDIAAGHCVNSTIKQNITFSTQGLPFGLSKKSVAGLSLTLAGPSAFAWALAAVVGILVWGVGL